ncbi:uncharacterized protein LOC109848956 [Asparagus officinalis]|uniref:uncharacterized protein LOC109848956 n=1 Tax=Asparagus officinalis TaxID=4686 RepID=UPI00098DF9AE|nr:uncharacterized protein LOC109848956 [Asparagus officinalis]XP_020274283.1 uncharacterized protein LOC109848956 [Asparagus officinalis]
MSLKSKKGFYPFLGKKSNYPLLVAFLLLMCGTGGATVTEKEPERPKGLNNPAVKTLTTEDGDIIDCVDIYKQPAFDHPLLRNHTIEMRPSFIPRVAEGNGSLRFLTRQIWQKNGSCPVGTIPVQRIRETNFTRISGASKNFSSDAEFANCRVEIARVENHRGGPHFGAQGTISVWNLDVMMMEWSLNSVTLFDVHDSFMEAGWAVGPILFEDVKPRLFVNWLDTSADMGCFNLRCPGFVQVSNWIVLGGVLPKISTFDGDQFSFTFTTYYV